MRPSLAKSITLERVWRAYEKRVAASNADPWLTRTDGVNKVHYERWIQNGGLYRIRDEIQRPGGGRWGTTRISRQVTNGKERDIEQLTYRDQHKGAILTDWFIEVWEPLPPFYGFPTRRRSGAEKREVASGFTHVIANARKTLRAHHWIVVADIRRCFPSINPDVVCALLAGTFHPADIDIARNAMTLQVDGQKSPRGLGVPQGSIFSGCALAFLLRDLPCSVGPHGAIYIYVDDILIVCDSLADAQSAYASLTEFLSIRGLRLKSPEDESIIPPDRPVTYLRRPIRDATQCHWSGWSGDEEALSNEWSPSVAHLVSDHRSASTEEE